MGAAGLHTTDNGCHFWCDGPHGRRTIPISIYDSAGGAAAEWSPAASLNGRDSFSIDENHQDYFIQLKMKNEKNPKQSHAKVVAKTWGEKWGRADLYPFSALKTNLGNGKYDNKSLRWCGAKSSLQKNKQRSQTWNIILPCFLIIVCKRRREEKQLQARALKCFTCDL